MIPDKIYVRKYRDGETSMFWDEEPYEDEIAGIEAVEFIRKDALLEWAKETYLNENASAIRKVCFKQLAEKLLLM